MKKPSDLEGRNTCGRGHTHRAAKPSPGKCAAGSSLQCSAARAWQSQGNTSHSEQMLGNPFSCLDLSENRLLSSFMVLQLCHGMLSLEEPGTTELGVCVDITGFQRMQYSLEVL